MPSARQDDRLQHQHAPSAMRRLYRQVRDLPHVKDVCDALPHVVLILDNDRRIIFTNRRLLELTGMQMVDDCLGMRPGELFRCINAEAGPSGCGTSEGCRYCGAMLAVLESQQGNTRAERELRLTARIGGDAVAFDFKVSTAPFAFDRQALTLVNLIDISDEKRRRVLERIFFHDILNTAGSLCSLSQLMTRKSLPGDDQGIRLIHLASQQLIEEIHAQRELMEAESGELKVNLTTVHSLDCLKRTMDLFEKYQQVHHIDIQISPASEGIVHQADQALLLRVLGNLVKNALEASSGGQRVSLGCRGHGSSVEYWVHNPTFMPREIQMQIFQRSFSTKGANRGLGTYSIRLLTEKFLNGTAAFQSSEEDGTRFRVIYPLQYD